MNKFFLFLLLFGISVSAQIKNIKIVDKENNSPLADSDIYFNQSTKNFISDINGNVMIDLNNVSSNDELIIAKKDYQNAIFKITELKADELIIQLEKVDEIKLQETFITNLKAIDILQKVIENYDKNFNTEQHFYKVNFVLDAIIDSINRDYTDVDLQFRFKKNQVKIHSNGKENNRIVGEGMHLKSSYKMNEYFNNISLLKRIESMHKKLVEKTYDYEKVWITKYADKYMYELEFKHNKSNVTNIFLIDKETFAIVEHTTIQENRNFENSGTTIHSNEVIYKYRLYQNKWILKESFRNWNTTYLDEVNNKHILDVKINLEVKDFSDQPFPEFNKSVNEKMDIRKSFNN